MALEKTSNFNDGGDQYEVSSFGRSRCDQQAEVIAVGPGGMVDGKEVTMQVKEGDQVIYSKYAGTEVKLGDEEYIVVKQSDILAIVED